MSETSNSNIRGNIRGICSEGEGNIIICQEVPDHRHSNRKQFCDIERKPLFKKIEEQIIDAKSYYGDDDKSRVLDKYFRIGTVKCPDPVQNII